MLSDSDKQRFARHLLLVEVGVPGQERLCDAQVSAPSDADARAKEVAFEYLMRAGARVLDADDAGDAAHAVALRLPDGATVDALAGDPALRAAAEWLAGSFAAVEAIKEIVGVGQRAALDPRFTLVQEVG